MKISTLRLFINKTMMKGEETALGKVATFETGQNENKRIKNI